MIRHFTATAFVTDSQNRVLLLWHKRLQSWMPPGGHVDENETPDETARREVKEETGLDVEIIGDPQPDVYTEARHEGRMLTRPLLMMLENIPEYPLKNQPAHEHMDFVFRARPLDETQALVIAEQEADHLRWFTVEEIQALSEKEIFTNVKSCVRMLGI